MKSKGGEAGVGGWVDGSRQDKWMGEWRMVVWTYWRMSGWEDTGIRGWGRGAQCSTLHKAPGLGCTQIPYELKQDPHVSFTLLMVPVFLVSQVESASFPCIKV